MKTRIVYFGSPELSLPFLSALVNEPDFDVIAVVTQPEKPVGRKAVLTKSDVHTFAIEHNIPVLAYKTLRSEEAVRELSALNVDVFIVVVYGNMIPKSILEIPKFGCLNVHPSLLPKFRGPSPFQEAIRVGEKETGVSIMLLDEGMDTGPVIVSQAFPIDDRETAETIQTKIISIGVPLLVESVKKWIGQKCIATLQDHARATYSKILSREDGKIDWTKSTVEIDRLVRAYKPWPGTYFIWRENGKDIRVSVYETLPIEHISSGHKPGSVVEESGHVFIVCGDQSQLELVTIQPEGKQKMSANDYVRGHQTFLQTNLISL